MQFLQANGSLIFFGLALVFMMWMHRGGGQRSGMGGGCGMGHEDHGAHEHDLQQTGPPVQGAKPEPSDPVEPIARATHTTLLDYSGSGRLATLGGTHGNSPE